MYYNSTGNLIKLGKSLGKGSAGEVFLHENDKSKAIKLFHPEYLQKEITLVSRIEKFYELEQIANFNISYGSSSRSVGSWPNDIVKDQNGKIVGYIMNTINNGIDVSQIIFAYDFQKAFYKYKNDIERYEFWKNTFFYSSKNLRNRFILSYSLANSFDKIYNIKSKQGTPIQLDICNFDIKPLNILVTIEENNTKINIVPFILDLDNLTLKNGTGKLGPTHPQYTPDYKAPEGPLDKYYDYFSIAVIFYQLIFSTHPFTVIGGTRFTDGINTEYYVKNKCFAWGRNRKFLHKETLNDFRHNNFNQISTGLQKLFIRAFDSDFPSNRPSMAEWKKEFEAFLLDNSIKFESIFTFR
jgi:serine/threonine protein kinase